ncbi:MAG: ABC transporter ATP-binding protein [Bacteroidetes bacterium]|nr:ABC transporter ATP-binding protein [Bacteroidota bacterium]
MLDVQNVTVRFGGLYAVQKMNIHIKQGEIHALIGPNGAGKTTLFNVITRNLTPEEGSVSFCSEDISNLDSVRMIDIGISRTFQNLQLFQGMNVYDNIASGYIHTYKRSIFSLALGKHIPFAEKVKEQVMHTAEMLGLSHVLAYFPSQLSYGVLKRVELARALIAEPKLLMLDEPVAGLNDEETGVINEILTKLNNSGITILLVEHDMNMVMAISDVISVMNFGKKIAEGTPEKIATDSEVIRVYLGEDQDARS